MLMMMMLTTTTNISSCRTSIRKDIFRCLNNSKTGRHVLGYGRNNNNSSNNKNNNNITTTNTINSAATTGHVPSFLHHHRNNNNDDGMQQYHQISSTCTGFKRVRMNTTITRRTMSSTTSSSSLFARTVLYNYQHNNYRYFTTSTEDDTNDNNNDDIQPEREVMAFDVLIVGGGPAGLAAAIRLKQLCIKHDKDLSVCVIDKGSEIGAHILSGNVFDPKAMYELFPDQADVTTDNYWTKEFELMQGSVATSVTTDTFKVLTNSNTAYSIPTFVLPKQLHNHGNYIISLSQLCRWLATKAEQMGVEIYPGFAASDVLIDTTKTTQSVIGIATRDVGLAKDGITKKSTFERGVELHARQTLFAEGARGSCSEYIMKKFNLRTDPTIHPQAYGLGIKEVWQVPAENFKSGLVQHTIGYPLQSSLFDHTFGGSFMYHQDPDLVLIGYVVGLDYRNPYINPYLEFQKWKTHSDIKQHLLGGTCISYGARVLNEGGYHSIPKLTFNGGALIGCAAGFLNAVKIKGSHTAMKSGIVAAEATFDALINDPTMTSSTVAETGEIASNYIPIEIKQYESNLKNSWVYKELYEVRNTHAAFAKWGIGGGLLYTGLTTHITKGREPWTLRSHKECDADMTGDATKYKPIQYLQPDNKITFDLLTNLQRSGTYHTDDQPNHLRIKPELQYIPESISYQKYAGPEQRFCPAGVYEYVDTSTTTTEDKDKDKNNITVEQINSKKLVINSQNCIHCKCCSIKMPKEYIDWTVPEGGGGPQYQVM